MVEEAMKSYWFMSWSVTAGRDSGQEGSSATRLEISFCSDLMSAEGRQQQQQRVPSRLVMRREQQLGKLQQHHFVNSTWKIHQTFQLRGGTDFIFKEMKTSPIFECLQAAVC